MCRSNIVHYYLDAASIVQYIMN